MAIDAISDSIQQEKRKGGARWEGNDPSGRVSVCRSTLNRLQPDVLINNSKPEESSGESAGNWVIGSLRPLPPLCKSIQKSSAESVRSLARVKTSGELSRNSILSRAARR